MMINCPKCGFQQPKDEFCASCGVDMYVYGLNRKAKKRQVGLYVSIGALASLFVLILVAPKQTKQIKNLASEVIGEIPNAVSDSSRLLGARKRLEEKVKPSGDIYAADSRRVPQVETSAMSMSADAASSSSEKPAAEAKPAEEEKPASKIRVVSMLLDMKTIRMLQTESIGRETYGSLEFSVHEQIKKRIEGLNTHGLSADQTLGLQVGNAVSPINERADPGPEDRSPQRVQLSLRLTLTPLEITAKSTSLVVDTSFSEEPPMQFQISVPKKSGFWMRGLAPRLPKFDDGTARSVASMTILKVLAMPDFNPLGRSDQDLDLVVVGIPQ